MNDIVTLDAEQSSALTTIETTNFALVFVPGGVDLILERIKRDARAEAAKLDISTEKNREAILALKRKVVRSRTTMDAAGKDLKADWLAKSNAIDADRRKARAELEALEAEIEAPVVAYQKIKDDRDDANKNAIAALEALVDGLSDLTADQVKERFHQAGVIAEFPWAIEFTVKAERVQNGVIAQLEVAHARAKQREADAAAEVIRLAEEAETQRLAAIEAQRIREEQIAREAADRATRDAEALAERQAAAAAKVAQDALDAAEARAQAERDAAAQREREAEAKATHDREIAQQVAARAETARVDGHHAAMAIIRKLATPLAPPDPVPVIDAKLAQLRDVREREWEEYIDEAGAVFVAAVTALEGARAESIRLADEKVERERLDTLERERIAVEQAEIARAAEVAKVEREKAAAVEAATLAEQRRAAAVKAEEDRLAEARAKNREHKAKINGEVLIDIIGAMAEHDAITPGNAEMIARSIVKALAKNEVRHCKIEY